MARGTKRKPKHSQSKGKFKKRKTVNGVKHEKKYRDFRHIEQRKSLALKKPEPRREVDVDDHDEEHVDPLQLLLSTFSDSRKFEKPKAVDSDSDEESDEDVDVKTTETIIRLVFFTMLINSTHGFSVKILHWTRVMTTRKKLSLKKRKTSMLKT